MPTQSKALASSPTDEAGLATRIGRGDHGAFETLMRKYNGRLFRVARAILRDDAEAEDALQDAYLDAYRHIADFRGGSALSTWLTRIVVNRSLMRLRRQKRERVVVPFGQPAEADADARDMDPADERAESPAGATLRAEIRAILERRIDELPLAFRTVFVMREVDDMTVEQTAECLSIPPATVRTRLFRARSLLRQSLASDIESATAGVFGFAGERCDRIVARVLARLTSD
jgi:RNA polymerase sigma-70 factor (ECF subfamily)